jgi:hypothetical protein
VARPSKWGNPYVVGDEVSLNAFDGMQIEIALTADLAVTLYRELMITRLARWEGMHPDDAAYADGWVEALGQLRGRDLACWCPLDQPCHADVLLELANQ